MPCYFCKCFFHIGQWFSIKDCDFIKCTKFYAKPITIVLLLNNKKQENNTGYLKVQQYLSLSFLSSHFYGFHGTEGKRTLFNSYRCIPGQLYIVFYQCSTSRCGCKCIRVIRDNLSYTCLLHNCQISVNIDIINVTTICN